MKTLKPAAFKKSSAAMAVAAGLTLALAACGGPAEEPMEVPSTAASETAAAAATPSDAAATPTPSEAAATPSAEASATPSAAASASPSPAATTVAAAAAPSGPPETFKQCAACHKVAPGEHGIGPSLAGVFGEKAGHLGAAFKYSDAMLKSGLTWDQATLDRYLADPRGTVPGTKMAFAGVKDAGKRAEVIAYLKTL